MDGYIVAIWNLGLTCFLLANYTHSCKKSTKLADAHFDIKFLKDTKLFSTFYTNYISHRVLSISWFGG